jgi:predicted DNA-binding antitoxin AbrB/MazE fold protein
MVTGATVAHGSRGFADNLVIIAVMVRHVDAIFSHGAFRPIEPLALPEGTRVHLRVEEKTDASRQPPVARVRSPKLARPEDAADFVMDVREAGHAGV